MSATQLPRACVCGLWTVMVLLLSAGIGCVDSSRPDIDEHLLLLRIKDFETKLAGKGNAQKVTALAGFADDMLHRHIRVRSATVVAVYERGDD